MTSLGSRRVRGIMPYLFILFASLPAAGQGLETISAEYYGETGCSHCDTFAADFLPAVEQKTGVQVELTTWDILSASGYERCKTVLAERGYEFTIFPVLVIGNNVYQGSSAVETNLEAELAYFAAHGEYRPKQEPAEKQPAEGGTASAGKEIRLAFLPILLAGLVDGINPCAFTTLLFFISYLALRGRTKKIVLLYGLLFAAGVFTAYLAIGFGFTSVLTAGLNLSIFRLILRIAVSAATVVFAALSIVDFIKMRRGGQSAMILALPGSVRQRINAVIRAGAGAGSSPDFPAASDTGKTARASVVFAWGVFLTGIIVSILELACTGQVYLPTLSYMVQTGGSAGGGRFAGIGGLLLYNIAFILPLLAVLVLTVAGVSQQKVAAFFKSKLGLTKLILAGVFIGLAVLVWIF